MKSVVLEIIENAKYNGIKYEDILLKLERIDKSVIDSTLRELELDGQIYCKENNIYIPFPSNLSIASIQCSHKGNRYVIINNEKYFVSQEDINCALDFDTVVVKPNFLYKTAVVEKILKRENNKIVCEVYTIGKRKILKSYNTPGNIDIILNDDDLIDFVEGDRVVVEINNDNFLNIVKGKIVNKIGHKNDPDIEEISIANSKGFNTNFSQNYKDELDKISDEIPEEEIKKRLDLRDSPIITIDDKDTKDIDDAISLTILENGNYLLGGHIADVSYFVKEDSEIYKEAYQRGTSLYLANSVIPMIHSKISNGICSLNPGVDRLTKSCIVEINKNGEIVNYQIKNSIINSKKKMTYQDVNMILEKGEIPPGYEEYKKLLLEMHKLSTILDKRKIETGYLNFASNEIKVMTDENNKTIGFSKREQHSAERLIENFMVVFNNCVATNFYWLDLPFPYRIHGEPDEGRIEDAIDMLGYLGIHLNNIKSNDSTELLQSVLSTLSKKDEFSILSTLFLKSMQKAKYSPDNIGHFALGLDNYTHFTSPIRRFPDLLVHTLIDYYQNNDITNIDFNQLYQKINTICNHSSYKERQADIAEKELNRIKMIHYMSDHIGETLLGRITEVFPEEISIITDNNIYGTVPIDYINDEFLRYNSDSKSLVGKYSNYYIGNKVELKVLATSIERKRIYFSIEKNLSNSKSHIKTKKLKY